jgi:hypothetical protein
MRLDTLFALDILKWRLRALRDKSYERLVDRNMVLPRCLGNYARANAKRTSWAG